MKKGIFHTFYAFALSATFILPATAQMPGNSTQSNPLQPLLLDSSNFLSIPKKTLGGSYSSNRLKGHSRRKFTPRNANRVRLKSEFPRQLKIANYDVVWFIESLKSRNAKLKKAHGKVSTIHLAPGKYRVTLKIGRYKQHSVIRVHKNRNSIQSISIPVNAGLLRVRTSSPGGTLKNLAIKVKDKSGTVVASSLNGRPLKRLLKAGKYTVETVYNNKPRNKTTVHITRGAIKETTARMPQAAKVRLRAFEKGNQPLMQRSSWVVYNASGKAISKTKTRTHRIVLLPGTYTAQLTVHGKKIKKKFKVASGRNKTVSIYL